MTTTTEEGDECQTTESTRSPELTTTPTLSPERQSEPEGRSSENSKSPTNAPTLVFTRPGVPGIPVDAPETSPFLDLMKKEIGDPGTVADSIEFVPPGDPTPLPSQRPDVIPMTELGLQVAARFREIFYAYSNRLDRSVQEHLGPSEVGHPCDRRIAMRLMRIPFVNPAGDNWASFIGTCTHVGLAEMLEWADANQGRFAVEVPLTFPSKHVPKGTSDALDRVLCLVEDHKVQGTYAAVKLRTKGPSETYRIQGHVYGLGQKLKGEKITDIAIVSWPRDKGNLDDLYVWTEPFDVKLARAALKRVDDIAKKATRLQGQLTNAGLGVTSHDLRVAQEFPIDTSESCSYCPFYAKNDKEMTRGCPGV